MLRVMVNNEGTGLIIYNQATESMFFEDEVPVFPLEYIKNKLLVTGFPSHVYLIFDWSTVKCIEDPNMANVYKTYAFTIPCFHETEFPFIFIVGEQNISIFNIVTLELKQLTFG